LIEVRQTETFSKWLRDLRDRRAVARIAERLRRLALGVAGDVKPVGEGLSELRIDYGPGYRVYFFQRGENLVVVLCGGDKTDQARDITRAKAMAKDLTA
jgi:putative addiction module killer protein